MEICERRLPLDSKNLTLRVDDNRLTICFKISRYGSFEGSGKNPEVTTATGCQVAHLPHEGNLAYLLSPKFPVHENQAIAIPFGIVSVV